MKAVDQPCMFAFLIRFGHVSPSMTFSLSNRDLAQRSMLLPFHDEHCVPAGT
jgi:hypothetical protein